MSSDCSTTWWSASSSSSGTATGSSWPTPTSGARSLTAARWRSSSIGGRTASHLRDNGFSERDIRGINAYNELFERLRRLLRTGPRDTWVGASPTRDELEELLGHDDELVSVVFEESIADTLDRYVDDERIKHALFGQGVIGAFAGPHDSGTASVRLMHHQGNLLGHGDFWGYVEGGMGRVSFAIAEAAQESGATLAAGFPWRGSFPARGSRSRAVSCFGPPS